PPDVRRSHRINPRYCSERGGGPPNVRFGSKADMCIARAHVRFTPNSDRKSGHRQTVRSALPPKADMCGALAYVCFGPKADIKPCDLDVPKRETLAYKMTRPLIQFLAVIRHDVEKRTDLTIEELDIRWDSAAR